jgi:hypothetical protein
MQQEQPITRRKPGRPKKSQEDKNKTSTFTLSPESRDYLKSIKNKSGFIDQLVKDHQSKPSQ